MPQDTSTAEIKLYGGSEFNVGSFEQSTIELVMRRWLMVRLYAHNKIITDTGCANIGVSLAQ